MDTARKVSQKTIMQDVEPDGVSASNVSVLALCKRHQKPLRKGQRNCHVCNREANAKYKRQLKRDAEAFGAMSQRIASDS